MPDDYHNNISRSSSMSERQRCTQHSSVPVSGPTAATMQRRHSATINTAIVYAIIAFCLNVCHAAAAAERNATYIAAHNNVTLSSSGNALWDGLVNECMASPTVSCFQKNVYQYLDGALQPGDVNVTSGIRFVRNQLDDDDLRPKVADNAEHEDAEDADDDDGAEDEARAADSPLEEVTDALAGRGVDFLMKHNVELRMPQTLFDGATVRISPRAFEGNGALLHFEIVPAAKKIADAGRLLFKPLKKLKQTLFLKPLKELKKEIKQIQKLFRNKLLLSFLAIVLIIKLIKVKLFWILPFIVGVGTAKKLMLKVLLFLFPALAHIFKLCSYYHKNYHDGTKYHHHKHQINHLHSVVPPWFTDPHHEHSGDHHDQHSSGSGSGLGSLAGSLGSGPYSAHDPQLIYTSPPKGHPSEYLHGGPPLFQGHPQDWELSGPGLGSEYISDRNAHVNSFQSKLDELNEVSSLGATAHLRPAAPPASGIVERPAVVVVQPYAPKAPANRVITTSQYHRQVITPKHVSTIVHAAQPQHQHSPPSPPPSPSTQPHHQHVVPAQYATVTDEKMLREAQRLQAKQLEALRIQAEQKLLAQQQHQAAVVQQSQLQHQQSQLQQHQQQKQPQTAQPIASESSFTIDPVYSPILQKVDQIMQQLSFHDEACKERLICSMYKSPAKYSPHSNFISAELSRDMSELPKPTNTNAAVVRFYRYVQAARDGQDQRDCPHIYGQCTINTDK